MADRAQKIAEVQRLQKIAQIKELQGAIAQKQNKPTDVLGATGAGIEALGRSATFGLADVVGAAADPLVQSIMPETEQEAQAKAAMEAAGITEIPAPEPGFRERLDARQQRAIQQEEEFPISTTVGNLAGALTGGTAVAKGAGALARWVAPRAAGALASAAEGGGVLGLGARTLGAAGEGAAIGAAAGLEQAIKTGDVSNIPDEAKESALISAAFPLAGAAIRSIPRVAKKGLSTFLGAKEEAIDVYLKRAKDIDHAKSIEELGELADDAFKKINKAAIDTAENSASVVRLTLEDIKSDIINKSQDAFDILESSGKVYSKKLLLDAANDAKNTIKKVSGKVISDADDVAIKSVDNWINKVKTLSDDLSAPELKSVIQALDRDTSYIKSVAGSFDSPGERVLKSIRRSIDKRLKTDIPLYAEKMEDVSSLSQFLDVASKKLGEFGKAESALSKIASPNKPLDETQRVLRDVAKRGGIDLERVRKAQENAKLFNDWKDYKIEDKVKQLMRNTQEHRAKMKALSEMSEVDFIREIENLSIKNHFEQQFTKGTRNVALWTVIGAGTGGVLGGISGANMGAVIDRYGPKIAQKILGAVSAINGVPTVRKVVNAMDSLPQNVKKDMVDSFRRTIVASEASNEAIHVPVEMRADVANEIKMNRSLSNVEKAKMLARLGKRGEVVGLNKIIDDTGEKIEKEPEVVDKKPDQPPRSAKDVADYIRLKRKHEF